MAEVKIAVRINILLGHNLNQWAQKKLKIPIFTSFIVKDDPKKTQTLGVGFFHVSMFCFFLIFAFSCLSSGRAKGAAKGSCGETVVQKVFLESPFLLCPLKVCS